MPSSPFVGAWTIDSWTPDDMAVAEGIPRNGFQVSGPLDISLTSILGADTFLLQWQNQDGQPCSVTGLEPDPLLPTKLLGRNLPVDFAGTEVRCDLTLTLTKTTDPKELSGVISVPETPVSGKLGPDTGSGTFTATANGG